MSERFYSDARLYDRLFPGGEPAVEFYRWIPVSAHEAKGPRLRS